MYFNTTTLRVLQVFVGSIGESFTLREVARLAQMHISLAHRATRPLVDRGIVVRDKHKHLLLNYKINTEMLSLAEYERRDDLLSKKKYEEIRFCATEVIKKMSEDSFVLLLFGSVVESEKPRDIDLLLIVEDSEKIEFHEKFLRNITSKYGLPFEERVISFENVYEMLAKREEMNMMNQLLKKHIILYGGELFYRLLQRGRT